MGKSQRKRQARACDECAKAAPELFRIKVTSVGEWLFTCQPCQRQMKQSYPEYQYGGTWKQRKRN